ncbi:MAG: elongation factor Ts [Dehalococcoidia bacterium]|nr:elongation factor Ts [Dehalococcoidia bacterium]
MDISVEQIKALREQTGAGILACKEALRKTRGNLDEAVALLRAQGLVIVAKKATRETKDGVVESYIHSGSRVGALIEMNCETDFVARTEEFRALAHSLAMQVAAMQPLYINREEIPSGENVNPEEACLLEQPFIKDSSKTVRDLINEIVAKVGENIRVRRFERYSLGE